MAGIKALVCPHHSHQILCLGQIDDVMGIAREHMDCLNVLTGRLELYYLVIPNFSLLNQPMTRYYDEKFPLGVMPVLTLSNTRLCDIDGDLTAGVCFQKLRKAPSLIPIHFERKRHLVRGQIGCRPQSYPHSF